MTGVGTFSCEGTDDSDLLGFVGNKVSVTNLLLGGHSA